MILFTTNFSLAEIQDYKFTQLKIEDGLSQSTVYSIIQDKKGFMSFRTDNGLNKFDGYKFSFYLNDPSDNTSISDDRITTLFEDANGTIWIGTYNGGLILYNKISGEFKSYQFNPNDSSSIAGNHIQTILIDGNNNYIGTFGCGICRAKINGIPFNQQFKFARIVNY